MVKKSESALSVLKRKRELSKLPDMNGESGRPLKPRLVLQMVKKRESALSVPKRKKELSKLLDTIPKQ